MLPTVHSTANGAPYIFHIPVYLPFLELFFPLLVSVFSTVTDSTCQPKHSLSDISVTVNDPVASFGMTGKCCVYWSSAVAPALCDNLSVFDVEATRRAPWVTLTSWWWMVFLSCCLPMMKLSAAAWMPWHLDIQQPQGRGTFCRQKIRILLLTPGPAFQTRSPVNLRPVTVGRVPLNCSKVCTHPWHAKGQHFPAQIELMYPTALMGMLHPRVPGSISQMVSLAIGAIGESMNRGRHFSVLAEQEFTQLTHSYYLCRFVYTLIWNFFKIIKLHGYRISCLWYVLASCGACDLNARPEGSCPDPSLINRDVRDVPVYSSKANPHLACAGLFICSSTPVFTAPSHTLAFTANNRIFSLKEKINHIFILGQN